MIRIALSILLAFASHGVIAAGMPTPDNNWRIAGMSFGVRHMIEKPALCANNKIYTYSMSDVHPNALGSTYRGVSNRIRLICRIPPSQTLAFPVEYKVGEQLVATFVVTDKPLEEPFPRATEFKAVSDAKNVSRLFQSYWDSYADPKFKLDRRMKENLPAWAYSDYIYALAVDRKMHKVGVYDVYFDSRFESGSLNIADTKAFQESIELGHPLAIIMSTLEIFPYFGVDTYDAERFWSDGLASVSTPEQLRSNARKLAQVGFLQGDIFLAFLNGEKLAEGGEEQIAGSTKSPVAADESSGGAGVVGQLDHNSAYVAIQNYFRDSDCDSFPRVFFNDPQNDSPKRIALAAIAYRFVADGCGVGIKNNELVIGASSAELVNCSKKGSSYQCGVLLQYQCDSNGFNRGTSQAKLACLPYIALMANSRVVWAFRSDKSTSGWIAEFVGK